MNSQQFLNDEILEKRIETFYGYGNYEGKYWFIGMEEAGDGSFEDTDKRINLWGEREQREIDDLAEYHIGMGWPEGFQAGAKLYVPVWRAIMRMVLTAKGRENITTEDIRDYQIKELGRENKETCLLELLPLPSPSINNWIYAKHSKLPFLSDRDTYTKYCLEKRINHISQRIKEHQPKAVVFYGMGYEYYWRQITDVEFTKPSEDSLEDFFIGSNSQTVFVMAKFPRAIRNEYYHNIGKSITAKLAK
jgi:hypothetical protein